MFPETPEYITIPDHPHVVEEMKNWNIQGEPYQGLLGEISEWAARMALRDFPEGSEQLLSEVTERAGSFQLDLALSKLVDDGLMTMSWCDETEQFTFGLTEEGREIHGKA